MTFHGQFMYLDAEITIFSLVQLISCQSCLL